jgi:hypothetical protein
MVRFTLVLPAETLEPVTEMAGETATPSSVLIRQWSPSRRSALGPRQPLPCRSPQAVTRSGEARQVVPRRDLHQLIGHPPDGTDRVAGQVVQRFATPAASQA